MQTVLFCGKQDATIQLDSVPWTKSVTSDASTILHQQSATALLITSDVFPPQEARYYQTSDDGTAIAFFAGSSQSLTNSQIFVPESFHIITRDGRHMILDVQSNWLQVGPELQPGHWGILSQGADGKAVILDIDWTGNKLAVSTSVKSAVIASFTSNTYHSEIFIAPHWSYIAYTKRSLSSSNFFTIYDIENKRILWQIESGDGTPNVAWLSREDGLAIVNIGGSSGNGKLLKVGVSGDTTPLIDMDTILGPDSSVVLIFNPEESLMHNIVFYLQPGTDNPNSPSQYLFTYNITTKVLKEYCSPPPNVTLESINWLKGGKYFVYQQFDNVVNQWTAITVTSVDNGDYNMLYPTSNKQTIGQVVGWPSK